MEVKELNVEALDEALVAIVGLKKSKVITDVYAAIDKAEKRGQAAGFAEGSDKGEQEGFENGYDAGLLDGEEETYGTAFADLPEYFY